VKRRKACPVNPSPYAKNVGYIATLRSIDRRSKNSWGSLDVFDRTWTPRHGLPLPILAQCLADTTGQEEVR